jgi:hypothetical protein
MLGESNSDVKIHSLGFESLSQKIPVEKKSGFHKILFSSDDVLYVFDNEPLFRVRYGKEIIVNPDLNIDLDLRYTILGVGLGTLLMQRDILVLHASSINFEGEAVAFLGYCGEGKSTIATAMSNKGYLFVTDDILTVKFTKNSKVLVFPSYPRTKLGSDVIRHMFESNSFPRIHPEFEKYSYSIKNNFSLKPLPLKMIYILENSDKNAIMPLKTQQALMELVKNSYAINLFGNEGRSQNLSQCARLVINVPVRLLKRSESLNELEDLTRIVEEDVLNIKN